MKNKLKGNGTTAIDQGRNGVFKFPKIIKLVREADDAGRRADGYLWRIGDALIAECGPPGRHGVNTGTKDKLKQVARELKQARLGEDWSLVYLSKLRATAAAFADDKRLSSLPWSVHLVAGKPATLLTINKAAEIQGKRLTVSLAKKLRKQMEIEAQSKGSQANRDRANAEIVASDCIKEAADIQRRIAAIYFKLKPHLAQIKPERAEYIAERWDTVVLEARTIAIALRERDSADLPREAAE
jgi:hypothetical protein